MDYKYEIQMLAEEKAEEIHGTDFYSLSQDKQNRIYQQSSVSWLEKQYAKAELMGEDR